MNQPTIGRRLQLGLLLSLLLLCCHNGASATTYRPADAYYYDLGTGELFIGPYDDLAPIIAPSGNEGVRAFVFSCTDCDIAESRYVGWLISHSPEKNEWLVNSPEKRRMVTEEALKTSDDGQPLRTPESEEWLIANSDEAIALIKAARETPCPDGDLPRPCQARGPMVMMSTSSPGIGPTILIMFCSSFLVFICGPIALAIWLYRGRGPRQPFSK